MQCSYGGGLSEQVQTPSLSFAHLLASPSQAHSRRGRARIGLPSRGCGVISGSCTELGTCAPQAAYSNMSPLNNKHVSWALRACG